MKSRMEKLLRGIDSESNVIEDEREFLEELKSLMPKNFRLYAELFGKYCDKKLCR